MNAEKRYPKGHFIALGLVFGIPMGVPIGLAFGNIGIGFAIALPIGLVIGIALEKENNKNPIELSEEEMAKRKKLAWGGVVVGLIALLTALVIYFQMK